MALATAIISIASCKKDIPEIIIPDDQKGLIQFSMSDEAGSVMTKAGFGGSATTEIVARISSSDGNNNVRHTRTLMTAQVDNTLNNSSVSDVAYSGDAYKRYWDDCFGRNAKVSVYAIAVPNKTTPKNNNVELENKLSKGSTNVSSVNQNWQTDSENNDVSWTITTGTSAQSSETIANEDLCYSNNIQATSGNLGKNGRLEWDNTLTAYRQFQYSEHSDGCSHDSGKHDYYPTLTDGQMIFQLTNNSYNDGPGHFDRGHMIFKHATTRITIDLVGGEGFKYDSDFNIVSQNSGNPASINLLKMNTSGTLNIQSGKWSGLTTSDNTFMSCGSKATGSNYAKGKTIYSLTAQVLPGFVITDGDDNSHVFTFRIDESDYNVTMNQVFDALNTTANITESVADGSKKVTVEDGKITLEQGKNYHFSITVGKKEIDALTCTLVDWVDVDAAYTAKNAYITFESLQTEKNDCEHFDLYRVLNLNNTITDPTHTTFDGTSKYMTGYATDSSPIRDMLSTDGENAGITLNSEILGDDSRKVWKTTWFFESNKSFYHFRTVNPGTTITSDETNGDYFTMYSGPVNDTYSYTDLPNGIDQDKYNDYHWGAIYKKDVKLTYYTSDGYNSQLAGPVGPTASVLNITEQHMMSNINVFLLTPADNEGNYTTASIDLYDESKTDGNEVSDVKITNYSGSATVRMGTGLVTPAESTHTSTITTPAHTDGEYGTEVGKVYYLKNKTYQFANSTDPGKPYYHLSNAYSYRVVPQPLVNGSTKVGLVINTPDENLYYVVEDLSKIKVSKVTGNALKNDYDGYSTSDKLIERWLPGYTYNYYFILKKTGIEAMTCTIVDWVTVEAGGIDVDLES